LHQNWPHSSFAEHWIRVFERLGLFNDRLTTELESCWRDLQSILESQLGRPKDESSLIPDQPNLRLFHTVRGEAGRNLLHEPASQWERRRPFRRALMAMEMYDRSLEELVRALPETVPVSGPEALGSLDQWVSTGWRQRLARLRRKERSLPLKAIIVTQLRKLSVPRTKIEGQYFLALALAIRQLRKHWEATRAVLDASVLGQPLPNHEVEEQWEEATTSTRSLVRQVETALSEWRTGSEATTAQVAKRIVAHVLWRRRRKTFDATTGRAASLAHWVELFRAVEAEVRLEIALESTEGQILTQFQRALDSLSREQTALLTELDDVIDWLRRRIGHHSLEDFPSPKVDVVPASSRLTDLESSLKAELETLPESVQTLTKLSPLPRRRTKWNKLYPRETLDQAFLRAGRPAVARVLGEIESEHRKIVQEIERAREVVAFGLEAAGAEQDSDPQVAREALQNALSLLEFSRDEAADWRSSADTRMARALAAVFVEGRLILSRHRLGVLTYLAQQGLRRAIVLVSSSAVAAAGRFLRRSLRILERLVLGFLVYIGWRPAPSVGQVEVVTRPFLPQEFTVDLTAKELPAIYRRLFRFEAVRDPRFLVGREREMGAIAEARSFWEAGRPVALLIVGERGSGKTSLISCALRRSLDGLEVIRGEFGERLITESQLRDFLARLLGVGDPAELERFLAERRRVIILEELERTFLRQVGHYAAIRTLQRMIAATCSSTLWILVTNQVAFQYLDAAVNLGDSFSHRINAASINREALRQAILLRHNLSGLRLQFALPPSQRGPLKRLTGFIQGQADAETIFFDTLAKESAGIFRTAFDIWLGQIESVQAGVLSMNPLVSPNLSPVIDALDLADLFTLVAVLQHGSLTPEEHATIFQKSVAASRSQMDELVAREIIEPDPGRPGFRVRPEALRVVHEALYRRNLL